PGQRRHDALTDAGWRLLRSGDLPDAGGTPATVLIHLTLDQLEPASGWPPPPTAAPSRSRPRSSSPRTPRSFRWSSTPGAPCCTWAARGAAPVPCSASPSPPATAAAPSPPATGHPTGAKPTTSTRGPTAAPPTWTTPRCYAASITASTPNAAGLSASSTAWPNGSRPAGSIPSKCRAGNTPTTCPFASLPRHSRLPHNGAPGPAIHLHLPTPAKRSRDEKFPAP